MPGIPKLNEQIVIEILSNPDAPIKETAQRYNINQTAIYNIFANITWKRIDRSEYPKRKYKHIKLTAEDVFAIRAVNRPSLTALANKYGISRAHVARLRDRNYPESWKDVPFTFTTTYKLTKKDVAEIRAMPNADRNWLAKKYDVHPATITKIRSGRMWKNIKPASYDLSFSL
jgi:hypothetical protein